MVAAVASPDCGNARHLQVSGFQQTLVHRKATPVVGRPAPQLDYRAHEVVLASALTAQVSEVGTTRGSRGRKAFCVHLLGV